MKIIHTKFGKHPVLNIQTKEIRQDIFRKIKTRGLYALESVYGNSDGHGEGCGGEDISFSRKRPLICFNINWNGKRFQVWNYVMLYDANGRYYDTQTIDPDKTLIDFLKLRFVKGNAKWTKK